MEKIIIHATVVDNGKAFPNRSIMIRDGKIEAVFPSDDRTARDFEHEVIDAQGLLVTPGLIDIHIHGCMGVDAMDADDDALNTISDFLASHGVTSFYATTITQTPENVENALKSIARQSGRTGGANLLGAHVEGPYINAKHKGAQNPDFLRIPAPEEYQNWIRKKVVRLITIAPELEGADEMIRYCRKHEVEVAVGHSGASFEQVVHAADLGLSQATHLFNGMQGLHHREPGTVGGALWDSRIFAQVITDGIHLHPAIVDLIVKIKGIDRTILISDSIRACGLSDGKYDLGGQTVNVRNGEARIENGSLAGSTLTLDQAVRNTMDFTGLDFEVVVAMATAVPAQAMKIAGSKGSIKAGCDADLAFFDNDFKVAATMINGSIKYQRNKKTGE